MANNFHCQWRGIFTLFLLLLVICTKASTIVLGYCNENISAQDFRTSLTYDCPVMGAVKFTSSQLSALKGGRITQIRLGAEAGMKGTYLWIRPSLDQPAIKIQRLGTTVEGWNELTLSDPYIITGEDIYVGFNGTLPAGKSIILNGTTSPNGAFLAQQTTWSDLHDQNQGSLLIQAVVEYDGDIDTEDIGIENVWADGKFARNGERRTLTASIANYGKVARDCPDIHFQVGSMEPQTVRANKTIAPGANIEVSLSTVVDGQPDGKADVRVWFDLTDASEGNNSLHSQLYVYTTAYPRKVLLEQFTTINCTNCPTGERTLAVLLNGRDSIVRVSHHVGYGEDELTVQASRDIMDLGATSAPLAMLDRTPIFSDAPTFAIAYTNTALGVNQLKPGLDYALAQPSFVSVKLDCTYDENSRQLIADVSGERNPQLYQLLYGPTNVTVYLVEDNVKAETPQQGSDTGDLYHNHVLRQALTASYGDPITWSSDSYKQTFSTTLPSAWKAADLKVVAFVNQPMDGNVAQAEVLNTESCRLSSLSGINDVEARSDKDGHCHKYVNLRGQEIDPTHLTAGDIFIEATATGDGWAWKKRIAQ